MRVTHVYRQVFRVAYSPHALIALSGVFNRSDSVNEVWSSTFRGYVAGGGGWLTDPHAYMEAIAPNVSSWWSTAANRVSTAAVLTMLKVNNIGPDGKYKDNITNQHPYPSPATGATGGGMPSFVTAAVTLETGVSIGVAKRGRTYIPFGLTLAAATSYSISAADMTALSTAIKGLLTIFRINDPGTSNLFRPAIVSKTGATFRDISGVSCDSIMDVQRRRKSKAVHTRSAIVAFP